MEYVTIGIIIVVQVETDNGFGIKSGCHVAAQSKGCMIVTKLQKSNFVRYAV